MLAPAVFTRSWNMENHFYSSPCFFTFAFHSHPESLPLVISFTFPRLIVKSVGKFTLKVFEFLMGNQKRKKKKRREAVEENGEEEEQSPARCVYLTEINWFIDNFARERARKEATFRVFTRRWMEGRNKNSSIFDLHLIIILTECWKGKLNKRAAECARRSERFSLFSLNEKRKRVRPSRNHGWKIKFKANENRYSTYTHLFAASINTRRKAERRRKRS